MQAGVQRGVQWRPAKSVIVQHFGGAVQQLQTATATVAR